MGSRSVSHLYLHAVPRCLKPAMSQGRESCVRCCVPGPLTHLRGPMCGPPGLASTVMVNARASESLGRYIKCKSILSLVSRLLAEKKEFTWKSGFLSFVVLGFTDVRGVTLSCL